MMILGPLFAIFSSLIIFKLKQQWNPREGTFYNVVSILVGQPDPQPLFNATIEEQVAHIQKINKKNDLDLPEFMSRLLYADDILAASFGPNQTVVVDIEIPSRETGRTIPATCSRPSGIEEGSTLPLVLHFHYGGLVMCTPLGERKLIRYLSKDASAVVCSVNYRKPPLNPYPATIHDALDSSLYLIEHGSKTDDNLLLQHLGVSIDPSKIVTFGASAGGYLSGITNRLLAQQNVSVSLQVSLVPMAKPNGGTTSLIQYGVRDAWTQPWNTYAWSVYLPGDDGTLAQDWRVSLLVDPPAEIVAQLPPVYLQIHQFDVLYDEGRMYGEKLQRQQKLLKKVEVETTHAGGTPPLDRGGPGDGTFQRAVKFVADFLQQ